MEINKALEFVRPIRGYKNKHLASLLDELEQVLGPNSEEYARARKVVLDHFNNFYRAIFKLLLGIDPDERGRVSS